MNYEHNSDFETLECTIAYFVSLLP